LGRGRHGSFFTGFAQAVMCADDVHFQLLRPLAKYLIEKYELQKYLDTFQVTA
jgi:hypothetical protein